MARYMEERDSKETKLDLGVMRISLSEVDGILGETTDEDEAALEFDRLNAQVLKCHRIAIPYPEQ